MSVRCPCCGYRTLTEPAAFEICAVCCWEDDGQSDADAGIVRGGPNGALSLSAARENFARTGACDPNFAPRVRAPKPEEL
ncbi:MAG: CPCC family cysteine-rich protein [Pseudorhodoplanes sp.]|uniref:CPCC family cysteine-rich protein n=1 Tax=Pseudorhodoplanes sp. TaxID=1934341 RepID=UPI003D0A5F48